MPVASFWPLPPVIVFDPAAAVAPALTEDDFLGALQSYLPRGKAWPRDPGTVLSKLLRGFAVGFARVHARALALLKDAFPAGTEELLPEWEASLGLPDPCAGEQPLISDRQAQVVARFAFTGGQSVPYFIRYAGQLGYAVTITEFSPSRFGRPFGLPFGGDAWAYHWEVDAPSFSIHPFLFGADVFGTPFRSWDNAVLQCELQRLKPGHTTLSFLYS